MKIRAFLYMTKAIKKTNIYEYNEIFIICRDKGQGDLPN